MTPRYREFAADAALAPHVHCVWSFDASEDGGEQAIPPDGRAELIVHRGRPYQERGDDGRWRAQPALVFAGQLTRPLVLRSRGAVAVLAVRFTPAGAWAFAGRTMAECNDRRVPLAELHGSAAARALAASLDAAADASAARAALAAYVARRVALNGGRRDEAVERCVARLYASEGRVALAELCALAGVGERQLQRRFAEVVGIAPRTLAVVVRLRRVFDALRDAPWSTWSERAQAAGFFDHPQMARDFRRLLGRTPSQWAKRSGGIATSLVDAAS
nr:helix-turn-helix domain-containing protein [Caldimonas sp.]